MNRQPAIFWQQHIVDAHDPVFPHRLRYHFNNWPGQLKIQGKGGGNLSRLPLQRRVWAVGELKFTALAGIAVQNGGHGGRRLLWIDGKQHRWVESGNNGRKAQHLSQFSVGDGIQHQPAILWRNDAGDLQRALIRQRLIGGVDAGDSRGGYRRVGGCGGRRTCG